MNKKFFYRILIIFGIVIIGIGLLGYYLLGYYAKYYSEKLEKIINFEECIKAGGGINDYHYPRTCYDPYGYGKMFVEENSKGQIQIKDNLRLTYNIGGCEDKKEEEYTKTKETAEKTEAKIIDGFLNLTFPFNYLCCAKLKVYLDEVISHPFPSKDITEPTTEPTTVKLKIKNEGEMCKCICDYKIDAQIGPLGKWGIFDVGNYLIQLYGVEFENQKPELLWEKNFSIPKEIKDAQLPNPASVYCLEQNGKLEIRKDKDENEYGVCIFTDGSKCEEWAFFRNECKKEVAKRLVKLYYYNPKLDKDECSKKGLVSVERMIPITQTLIQDTIKLLLSGKLTKEEQVQGISAEYPLEGLLLEEASLKNGILTLKFNDPNYKTSGGSCRVGILWSQIEATAKQFSEVKEVYYLPEEVFQP
jgi:putative hemolysin